MVFELRASQFTQVSSIQQKDEGRGNTNHVSIIYEYRAKIEAKLFETCAGIVKLIDKKLVPATRNGDSKVFYLKLKILFIQKKAFPSKLVISYSKNQIIIYSNFYQVRKEMLGDQIIVLQQLVSPFEKVNFWNFLLLFFSF